MDNLSQVREYFVTGSHGFIGNALSACILREDKTLVRLDRNRSFDEQIEDLADTETTANRVLVLCDWNGVYGNRDSLNLQMENVRRWESLVEIAVQQGFSRIVALGSQAEISVDQKGVPADTIFQPRNAYGRAKLEAFNRLQKITLRTDTKLVWGRLFSVYGLGMSKSSLIFEIISALLQGNEIELSEGSQKWNFLFVEDCARALMSILEAVEPEPIYNIASSSTHSIKEVAQLLEKEIGSRGLLKFGAKPYSVDEVFDMSPDISDLLKTGWFEKVDLRSGLIYTISFVRDQLFRN